MLEETSAQLRLALPAVTVFLADKAAQICSVVLVGEAASGVQQPLILGTVG